jgi:hypothetical protein
MRDLRELLQAVYEALRLADDARASLIKSIEELGHTIGMISNHCSENQIMLSAESKLARMIADGDAEKATPILRCLCRVYTDRSQSYQKHSDLNDAMTALMAEMKSSHGISLGYMDMHQIIAVAEHLVFLEEKAMRVTAPLPKPTITDSDGRPIHEVSHD